MNTQEKIDRWKKLKKQEDKIKKERQEIEESFMENLGKSISGKALYPGDKEQVKISYKGKSVVDQELAENLLKNYEKAPFRIKYELDKKLYDSIKELNKEAYKIFSKAVTFKPERPSFEIKEMKEK